MINLTELLVIALVVALIVFGFFVKTLFVIGMVGLGMMIIWGLVKMVKELKKPIKTPIDIPSDATITDALHLLDEHKNATTK